MHWTEDVGQVGVKNDSKVFGLSTERMELPPGSWKRQQEVQILVGKSGVYGFGYAKLEMHIREEWRCHIVHWILELELRGLK